MQYRGPHKQPATFGEIVVGWLFSAILIATLYVLYSTWPWWLLAVPFLFLLPVRRIEKPAEAFRKSLSAETGDLAANKVRKALVRTLLWLGIISALICFIKDVHLHNLDWALVPLVSLCLSYRLRLFSPPAKKWPKLRSALNSNLFEVLAISVVVLAIYSILLCWLQSLALNDTTLGRLEEWDERVQTVHEFLEVHTPKLVTFLMVLAVTIALRFMASIHPQLLGVAKRASGTIAWTTKWVERVSTVAAIAASLTFLATGESGPASQIGITLRTAKEEYTHFQSAVERRVDDTLRQTILEKAWSERPRTIRVAMIQSARFLEERGGLDKLRDKAHIIYDISVPDLQGVPSTVKLNTPSDHHIPADTAPEPSWTPVQIHQAAVDPSLFQEKEPTEDTEKKDAEDEIAKRAFEDFGPKTISSITPQRLGP